MTSHFPVVGFVGPSPISRMMKAPAIDLGVDFLTLPAITDLEILREFARRCDVIMHEEGLLSISTVRTLEREGFVLRPSSLALEYVNKRNGALEAISLVDDSYILSVLVARSPHNQGSVWTPAQLIGNSIFSIAPPQRQSQKVLALAQAMALEIANEVGLVGVMNIQICSDREQLVITQLGVHPTFAGNWTLEGSRTSQFEQHLRAILDLPLGDPTMTSSFAISATFRSGTSSNMYRPYLHLMARSPGLKFHQYRIGADGSDPQGHVTALGDDLLDLMQCVNHAIDYMSGAVDE